jgi:hypothetical protein
MMFRRWQALSGRQSSAESRTLLCSYSFANKSSLSECVGSSGRRHTWNREISTAGCAHHNRISRSRLRSRREF